MVALSGKRIAIVVTNYGVEQAELEAPRQAVLDAGGEAVVVTVDPAEVQTLVDDRDRGKAFGSDLTVDAASSGAFDGLIIPGGIINGDALRMSEAAVALIDAFVREGKPVAAICHGPWGLVETGRLRGKTLTSFPSLQTDITNAGATWVDEPVHVDDTGGWTLVTSRDPDDLEDFTREAVAAFSR